MLRKCNFLWSGGSKKELSWCSVSHDKVPFDSLPEVNYAYFLGQDFNSLFNQNHHYKQKVEFPMEVLPQVLRFVFSVSHDKVPFDLFDSLPEVNGGHFLGEDISSVFNENLHFI